MSEDRQLDNLVLGVAVERWNAGERAITSSAIYNEITAAGEEIAEGEMLAVLQDLRRRGLIRTVGGMNEEAAKRHGHMVIIWVDTDPL